MAMLREPAGVQFLSAGVNQPLINHFRSSLLFSSPL